MSSISTYTSTGHKPDQINDKMTAAFVKFEEDHKGTGRGLLGIVQVVGGIVYPLLKMIGALCPILPVGLKRRWLWLKEAGRGVSYIGHGLANIGVGLASFIPRVNADRFGHIEYAYEDDNEVLDTAPERRNLVDHPREPAQEKYLYPDGDLPENI